ncbi:MAG: 3-methyl-2-oxobutanoate hydroxymethyltransferase, partial [Spirochaetaceae bacterium]|nr:3-methyl-2-oxobutanoate hydroxymethyltransferase [Spirochaetaceae bacterium]
AGIPSFQNGKVQRLNDWLASTGESLEGAWFYSDSHNDLPLLRQVEHPVAVDPDPNLEAVARIVGSGVPVMGHLGLTPQSVNAFGGFRVQGRSREAAERLARDAAALQESGCFSMVLEAVPAATAETVSRSLTIPTIGIGAGSGTDGQVLVLHDLLGLQPEFKPRFVRRFMDGASLITDALNTYHQEVVSRQFPTVKEAYS